MFKKTYLIIWIGVVALISCSQREVKYAINRDSALTDKVAIDLAGRALVKSGRSGYVPFMEGGKEYARRSILDSNVVQTLWRETNSRHKFDLVVRVEKRDGTAFITISEAE